MKTKHILQSAILACAMALTGTAVAQSNFLKNKKLSKVKKINAKAKDGLTEEGRKEASAKVKARMEAEAKAKIDAAKKKGKKAGKKVGKKAAAAADGAADAGKVTAARARVAARKASGPVREKQLKILRKTEAAKVLKGKAMSPAVKAELEQHARRMSRLDRIEELAAAADDAASITKVEELREKEVARHKKWVDDHAM